MHDTREAAAEAKLLCTNKDVLYAKGCADFGQQRRVKTQSSMEEGLKMRAHLAPCGSGLPNGPTEILNWDVKTKLPKSGVDIVAFLRGWRWGCANKPQTPNRTAKGPGICL